MLGADSNRRFFDTIAYSKGATKGFTRDERDIIIDTFTDECQNIVREIEKSESTGVTIDTVLFPKNTKGLSQHKAFYKRFTQVMATPQYDVCLYITDDSKPNDGLPLSECDKEPAIITLSSTSNGVEETRKSAAFVIVDTFADYLSGTVPLPKSMLLECESHEYGIPDADIAAKWFAPSDTRNDKLYADTVKSIGIDNCAYVDGKIRMQFYIVFLAASFTYQRYLEATVGLPEPTVQAGLTAVYVPNDPISNTIYRRNLPTNVPLPIRVSGIDKEPITITSSIVTVNSEEGVTFTRPIAPFDRVMVNHLVTLWVQSGADKTGELPCISGKQFYERTHGGRYSGYVCKETLQEFKQYCKELSTVAFNAEYGEMARNWNKGKNIDSFKEISDSKDGYAFEIFDQLFPVRIVTIKNKGVETWGLQIKEKPAILSFAQTTGQFFDYPAQYLEIYKYDTDNKRGKLLPSSDLNSVITNHLACRVELMKHEIKKSTTGEIPESKRTIRYDTIYELAAATTGKEQLTKTETNRIRDTVHCILESWKRSNPQLIKDYTQKTETIAAGRTKMHKIESIVIIL